MGCMGFQVLMLLVAHDPSVLALNAFQSESLMSPLDLVSLGVVKESRMLSSLSPEMLEWVTTENITVNLHHYGVPTEIYQGNHKLQDFFLLISTNVDRNGKPFISTAEARRA